MASPRAQEFASPMTRRRRQQEGTKEHGASDDHHRGKGARCPQETTPRIQQAKKPVGKSQFLPIVAKPARVARKAESAPKLTRVAFVVSRLMEFCSKRELMNQTGHSTVEWPLVTCKELIDNALDAAEEAEIAPEITVTVEADRICIQDNAGGIDTGTIKSVLDYTVRVSSREAYVSPPRGAQGNALKTILAMGYVLQGARDDAAGVTVIETRGVAHRIQFRVDHVNNQPRIVHTTTPSPIAAGTKFTVYWPDQDLVRQAEDEFKELVEAYVWFNPHLTVRGTWLGDGFINVTATDSDWEKWRPRNPTSAHWYDDARLTRYLGAHVARDRDSGQSRTVRDFIGEFRGLSSTVRRRRIINELGCSHQSLAEFFGPDRVNRDGIVRLLAAMKKHSKPVAARHLGIIGREHFKRLFEASDGAPETFKYECRKGIGDDGIPYVIEFAFGLHKDGLLRDGGFVPRKIVTGANWSAAIENPFRRFGSTGEGLETVLAKVRANASQPVICALHLASARIQFADRGKSSIILDDNAEQPDD